MRIHRCNHCGTVYEAVHLNGEPGCHICPPVKNPAFQPDPTLPGFDPRPMIADPLGRNELVVIDPASLRTEAEPASPPHIVSEGEGVTVLAVSAQV